MAYNVFKRPMFKRGGSTTGTGIMSHVEPRIKAQRGYGNYSAGFPYEMSQFSIMPQSNIRPTNLNDYTNIPVKKNITYPITMDSIGGYGFIEPGPETNLETLPDWMLRAMGTEESRDVLSKRKTGIQTIIPEKTLSGGATSLDQIVKENIAKKIAKKSEEQQKDEVEKPEPKYKESDIKTDIENEIDLLTETLGPSISKAEKALLIAKAAGTPGGLTAKLDVAREEGLKLARQKTKDERAIKLAAYKAAKDIEKTKIAAGKRGETERLYDEYADLSVKKDRTPKEEAKFQALKNKLEKTDEGEALLKAYAGKAYDASRVRSLKSQIETLEAIKSKSDLEKKDLEKKKSELQEQLFYQSLLGIPSFEEGGRVMKQMGGSMEENNIVSTENVTQDQVEPTKTVQTLSYAELRDRLPKEITDDIVQLIAASERALQDFAYIRTQQDVNDFNAKYGVNLVLPASAT
tara:strand:+ start:2861 stop:4246 length:1386 start_codon:yes stop_codon:yes gene_type:complete